MFSDPISTGNKASAQRRLLLGLDVGGTKISGLAVNEERSVLGQVLAATDTGSTERAVESITQAIRRLLAEAGADPKEILAIGLGVPGQVQGGVVKNAVNLWMEPFPLANTLQTIFGAPVILENDVRTAALGVHRYFQERRPVENLAYLGIGTGIAAGLILRGEVYRGSNSMAGEVGHMIVDPNGPRCKCGNYGCLEALAAGPAIARQGSEAVQAGLETRLREAAPVTAEAVFQAARSGDVVAQEIIRRVCGHLARAIFNLLMTYDVDLLALGGGVAQAGEGLLDPLNEELAKLRSRSALVDGMLASDKIALVPAGFNPGAWGAVELAAGVLGQAN